jgi:hypothetical protein
MAGNTIELKGPALEPINIDEFQLRLKRLVVLTVRLTLIAGFEKHPKGRERLSGSF